MTARLTYHSPIILAAIGARNCKNSFPGDSTEDTLGPRDSELLLHCIRKGHESVLEHVVYTFDLECSRACLQELVRTRHASYSVRSTRYTLHKMQRENARDYLYQTGDEVVDACNHVTLLAVLNMQGKNDILKYGLPEALLTRVVMTINLRSFRNVVHTRTGRDVLPEYRKLVLDMIEELPDDHKVFVQDCIDEQSKAD